MKNLKQIKLYSKKIEFHTICDSLPRTIKVLKCFPGTESQKLDLLNIRFTISRST